MSMSTQLRGKQIVRAENGELQIVPTVCDEMLIAEGNARFLRTHRGDIYASADKIAFRRKCYVEQAQAPFRDHY
jgi:hypothetical protein